MRIQDSFFSAPNRNRSKAYTAAKEAENAKKQAKAERKAERAAKKKRKSKKGTDTPELVPNTVPWAIENTKKLGILNLSKMQLESVPDEVFESLPGTARILNISFNRITELDTRLCDYVLVQRLIANGNLLSSIPQNIVRMTALKKLDLASNKLTSLPDAFTGMRVLEHVDLSDNKLSELPPSFAELQLTALSLGRNAFTTAPLQVTSMEWLMALDLSHNQITSVPESYMSLTQLTALNLEHNKLADFPNVILQMCVELVTLRLTDNPMRMAALEGKASYVDFAERRRTKLRRQLDAGTITEADLLPCNP
ncbi:Leucine-rich repeat-containing protein [Chondrus crispus]|uniref:Leucine-rich repeat-containing protein n=1 Tax=Chondrus crispus TaxID=2769 RepID=R7QK78_CHOCR|nr:Leucine-rich repeat-containing protein [Chondrus crispus]CDF38927.1 Leucine-rich repeat-containing protein [Chondrus crispus]|eukprot:XP_005718832.1 Leucine-rich repeat-containing protein [Chondrus crispus]